MNITLTITGDTPEEIRSALAGLSTSMVTHNGAIVLAPEKLSTNGIKKTEKTEKVEKTPKEETVAVLEPKTSDPISLESVRSLVQAKSKTGKRDNIKALLTEFGVERVTALAKDQYGDFLAKLEAI